MDEFGLVPTDMAAATASVTSAAGEAGKADGASALDLVGKALPGSTVADAARAVGGHWRTGVAEWCGDVEEFGVSIEATSRKASATDDGVAGLFGSLFGGG